MKMIGIYQIVNVVNDKVYVGSSVNVERRWRKHKSCLKKNKHVNQYLQNAWNKYGEGNFQFELIEGILIKEKKYILEREQYWLDFYKSYEEDKGYNILITAGNNIGYKHTIETKRKMSEAQSGENHPLFGKHHSKESKQKISESHKGKHLSEETKQRMSENNARFWKGKRHSEETKQKMSEAQSGENHYLFGKHVSEETKQKLSEANKGKHPSEETKQKISESLKGENNPMFGIQRYGENNYNSKLTWIVVREIREKYKLGNTSHSKLAKEYDVSDSCIQHIINNRSWTEQDIFLDIL